jgi:hypothetical protein
LRSESKELDILRKEMLDYAEDLKDLERIKVSLGPVLYNFLRP